MSNMTIQEAMAKVTKLLRLSESSEPHEAALAAQRAQEILTRYNIDRAALSLDGTESEPEEEIQNFTDRAPLDEANARLATWKTVLANRLAPANQCAVYVSGSAIGIVGRASDVEKVRYMYALLVRETERLTDRHGKGCGQRWRNSFRYGVVAAIAEKLAQTAAKVASDMRAESTGNALVLVNQAIAKVEQRGRDVESYLRRNLKLRQSSRKVRASSDAHAEGYRAGQTINMGGGARGALGGGNKRIGG